MTIQKNGYNKNVFQDKQSIFYILSEKMTFLAGADRGRVPYQLAFFDILPKVEQKKHKKGSEKSDQRQRKWIEIIHSQFLIIMSIKFVSIYNYKYFRFSLPVLPIKNMTDSNILIFLQHVLVIKSNIYCTHKVHNIHVHV